MEPQGGSHGQAPSGWEAPLRCGPDPGFSRRGLLADRGQGNWSSLSLNRVQGWLGRALVAGKAGRRMRPRLWGSGDGGFHGDCGGALAWRSRNKVAEG